MNRARITGCPPGSAKGKKETLCFLAHLSLFNIRDVSSFMIEGGCALAWCVFDYTSKGRCVFVTPQNSKF
jgi:hypothetical protein